MEELLVETQNGVRTLTLNRPERLNAITPSLNLLIEQALLDASMDDDVRVVVITGAGRGFCAGLDLVQRKNQETPVISRYERLDELRWVGRQALGIIQCDKPIIAAINGIAAGAGFALSLACDIRFMSKHARVTTGYIRRALSPDGGMSYFLPRLVGQARAAEMIFTGCDITSEEAEQIGLVNRVFPDDEFNEQVMKFARNLAEGPPIALTLSKRLLTESMYLDLRTLLKQEITAIQTCFNTDDGKEGIQAFTEKRKPVFSGK